MSGNVFGLVAVQTKLNFETLTKKNKKSDG